MTDGDQRVLVIDDESQIRQFVRAGMELGGYNVSEAATGSDAVREITLHPIDLVILDLSLPDIDGSDLLERIRASSSPLSSCSW
jgi:DNA-binding response OmpR family regulator